MYVCWGMVAWAFFLDLREIRAMDEFEQPDFFFHSLSFLFLVILLRCLDLPIFSFISYLSITTVIVIITITPTRRGPTSIAPLLQPQFKQKRLLINTQHISIKIPLYQCKPQSEQPADQGTLSSDPFPSRSGAPKPTFPKHPSSRVHNPPVSGTRSRM